MPPIENYPALEELLDHIQKLEDFLNSFLINSSEDGLSEKDINRLQAYLNVASYLRVEGCEGEKAAWEQVSREIKTYECDRDRAEEEADKY